jgi:hypothetical protein
MNDQVRSRTGEPSFADIISAAVVVIGLITSWLYLSGWIYAYTYFDRFRIPLLMLDLPSEHFLVYGGLVVEKTIWVPLACAVVLVAVAFVVTYYLGRLGRFWVTTIVLLTIALIFALAISAGSAAALADFAEQRSTDYAAYPRVRVTWEGAESVGSEVTADLTKTDCGRLLAASKERLFLLRPVRGAGSLNLDTFVLPAEKTIMRILADYTSCP